MAEPLQYFSVFLVGMFGSFIGSQVGSGGTITVPFLVFLGLPPANAIGTFRLAAIAASLTTVGKFFQSGYIRWSYVILFAVLRVLFGVLGVLALFELDESVARTIVGFGVLIPLPFLFLTKVGMEPRKVPSWSKGIGTVLYGINSFWAGFFGPGAKTLFIYILTGTFGFTFVEALATQSIGTFVSRIVIFLMFVSAGMVYWDYGICLLLGTMIGSYIGVSMALKKGNRWIRLLLAIVVLLLSAKLIFEHYL